MTDRYAVVGNPVAHSRSPEIHAAFAAATGQALTYERVLAPVEDFTGCIARLRQDGFRGVNVTVPFKEAALQMATHATARARDAGAANTLSFGEDGISADNTDGAGLVRDLTANLGLRLEAASILIAGAGGATRGVLRPLLDLSPRRLVIVNRSVARAAALVGSLVGAVAVEACGYDSLPAEPFDLVINATSAGLQGDVPRLPDQCFARTTFTYDMMYAPTATPFVAHARQRGATAVDGLGMLVEQAAESFAVWRGVRPGTRTVLERLRQGAAA